MLPLPGYMGSSYPTLPYIFLTTITYKISSWSSVKMFQIMKAVNLSVSFAYVLLCELTLYGLCRLVPHKQQRCGFRREAKRPDTKKGSDTHETKASPSEAGAPGPPPPPPPPRVPRPKLFKPLMFTVGVGLLMKPENRCIHIPVGLSRVGLLSDSMLVYRLFLWGGGHSAI